MKAAAVGVVAFIVLVGPGCERPREETRPSTPGPRARQLSALPVDTLWIRGGRKEDQVLRYPEYLAHDATQIYATDGAARQVVAFDQRTGQTKWVSASSGAGVRNPGSITGIPGGGVAVLDAGTLVVIDHQGKLKTTASLIDGHIARQICALSDSTFLVAFLRERLPLAVISATGQTLERLELPWNDLRKLSAMQTQVLLAGSSGGRCIVSLAFGGGLASIRGGKVEWTSPYVEQVAIPKIKAKVTSGQDAQTTVSSITAQHVAARDVTVDDSVIAVVFEGAERKPGTLIDEYAARTGAYLRTRFSERRVVGIQQSGGRVFLLAGLNGYPALVALPARGGAR